MNTKLQFIAVTLLLIASTLISCNKSDDISPDDAIPELIFSVNERQVYTNDIEYSFDIISGGGGYKSEICLDNPYDDYASTTVSGNTITVKLVSEAIRVQVTDQFEQQKDLIIWSTNSSLQTLNYEIGVGYGFQNKGKFTWGSGEGYTLLNSLNPGNAELILNENGEYIANSLYPGTTSFAVRDSRGTVNSVRVTTDMGWNLEDNNLSVDIKSGLQYTFILKWGEGDIKVYDCSEEIKNAWLLILDKNEYQKHKVLQICVNSGSVGKFFVELTDSANNKAIITLNAIK